MTLFGESGEWQQRIGALAAEDMRRYRWASLISGLWYFLLVASLIWGMSAQPQGPATTAIELTLTARWLVVLLILTVLWDRLRKSMRVHASGEISRRLRRIVVVPFRAFTNVNAYDKWLSSLTGLPPV